MATIIRRPRLGRSSVRGIVNASTTGIRAVLNGRDALPPDDVYIRWGCTANVPARTVINRASAIHEVNNKLQFRQTLNDAGLCPPTFFHPADVPDDVLSNKVVIRPERHSQGRHVYVTDSRAEMNQICGRLGKFYISELINKVAEYRVFVVQGRAATVAKKTPGNPEDVAWNVAKGGRFDVVRWGEWPLKAVKTSIEAFNLSGLDFGGVDVMVDAEGNCYILEINSAPSLTSPYRQECMAKAIDYLLTHGRERIPLITERGGWRKFIHPAINEEAIIPVANAA